MEQDLAKDGNYSAIDVLRQWKLSKVILAWGIDYSPTENDPMIPGNQSRDPPLPLGWEATKNGHNAAAPSCFKDEFTRSVTLTRPKVSPITMRQVEVRFLQNSPELACHVDLLPCMRHWTTENSYEIEQGLEERFPYYDDSWFATEWNTEFNTNDVLGGIKEPRRIQTFTTFLRVPQGLGNEAMDFIRKARVIGMLTILRILWLVSILFDHRGRGRVEGRVSTVNAAFLRQ